MKDKLEILLKKINQNQLLKKIQKLPSLQRENLESALEQIDSFDLNLLALDKKKISSVTSLNKISEKDISKGEEILAKGKVALVVLSGGEGTRLDYREPKGTYPISPVRHKSFFQLICEKIKAAENKYKASFRVAFMVSDLNYDKIHLFFKKNNFFGLKKNQIDFFNQELFPFLDDEGKLLFKEDGSLELTPNGNGCIFNKFYLSLYDKYKKDLIQHIHLVPIDNPLADPFEAGLVGYHYNNKNEITIKCIDNQKTSSLLGQVVEIDNKIAIVEYMEMEKQKNGFANTGLCCFDLEFFKKAAFIKMPLHKVKKRKDNKMVCKYEKFIFDAYFLADKIQGVECDPRDCFAPLKNKEGLNSIESVRKAMVNKDIDLIQKITLKKIEEELLELSCNFYYLTDDLIRKIEKITSWKGYIDLDNL